MNRDIDDNDIEVVKVKICLTKEEYSRAKKIASDCYITIDDLAQNYFELGLLKAAQ